MRKSIFLTVFLLLFSSTSLWVAHGWVDQEKDTVTIEEKVLQGDKGYARGLVVNSNTISDNHLIWDTSYTIGKKPLTATAFYFSQVEKQDGFDYIEAAVFDASMPFSGMGMSSSSEIDLEEDSFRLIREPLKAVASRTEPGQRHKEVIFLKDYFEYYPLEISFYNFPMSIETSNKVSKYFSERFKIPVRADHKVEIEIKKNRGGEIIEIKLSTVGENGVYPTVTSVSTGEGCYFAMSLRSYDGKVLDPELPPECAGIHFIPFETVSGQINSMFSGEINPRVEKMKRVFAVDPEEAKIVMLKVEEDQSNFLLVTKENQKCFLTVIDRKTMTPLQKIELFNVPQEDMFSDLCLEKGFLVPMLFDGSFVVLSPKENGNYEEKIRGNFSEAKEMWQDYAGDLVMTYNGKSLAALMPKHMNGNGSSSFYISVYESAGLVFSGKYENSLDKALLLPQNPENYSVNGRVTFTLDW